jgi:dihydrofolate reductase
MMADLIVSPRTQYYTAATLDGYIADSEHSLEWLFQFADSETNDYAAFIKDVGALAMGSSTYEWILAHQESAGTDHPVPWPYDQPTWVFSTRELKPIVGADLRFVKGNVVPVHADMLAAADGKNVWVVGGGDLAGQFHDHGLLDEIIVTIASVTLGAGAPLLPRAIITPPLELMSVHRFGTSFVQLRYRVPTRK